MCRVEVVFNKNNVVNLYLIIIIILKGSIKFNIVLIVVGGRKGGYGFGFEVIRDVNGKFLFGRLV